MRSNLGNAAFEGEFDKLQELLTGKTSTEELDTALHLAIENENHTCVVALVEKGASINSLVGGWKALDHAVDISIDGTIQTGGKPGDEPIETITYLLERGADKRSALNLAKKYENEKIVQILENR